MATITPPISRTALATAVPNYGSDGEEDRPPRRLIAVAHTGRYGRLAAIFTGMSVTDAIGEFGNDSLAVWSLGLECQ